MTDQNNALAALIALSGQLRDLGLDSTAVVRHARLLGDAVERAARPKFKILDTCRADNGGILPLDVFGKRPATTAAGFVAFVPSAGAASRYSEPLTKLVDALETMESGDATARDAAVCAARARLEELRQEGALTWPLPEAIRRLVEAPTAVASLGDAERRRLLDFLQLPKALMPCVTDGLSFLMLKIKEHQELPGLTGQVYVAPVGRRADFEALARSASPRPLVLEQGPSLSTIRFTDDVRPLLDDQGRPSTVPAGHGALAQLFPTVGTAYPEGHSLFIRNIDNVVGTSPAARDATLCFLAVHQRILGAVGEIRAALAAGAASNAAEVAQALLSTLPPASPLMDADRLLTSIDDAALRALWELQLRLFHTAPGARAPADLATLAELYNRPVNTLGQVPNTGGDVGGTPCFIASKAAGVQKLCIEVPHASAEDKRDFLANPAKATHFNPVFAAAEITADPDYYGKRNEEFWLLSEKTYRGQKVVYFETVLYELLGNSRLANCVFVEVPRLVFHPHKTLKDGAGRSASDWLG